MATNGVRFMTITPEMESLEVLWKERRRSLWDPFINGENYLVLKDLLKINL